MKLKLSAALAAALIPAAAHAQETIDVGVLKDRDIQVVQKLLYPKAGRTELGVHAGWMPFDAFTNTPLLTVAGAKHLSESTAVELALSGGYGFKNAAMRTLEGPAYGIVPDAYRFLGAAVADVQWSPIYAKMNWKGRRVFHHDVYGLAGLGLTAEQAFMPDHALALAPTGSVGVGLRVFNHKGHAVRVQLRDDVLLQKRVKTADSQPFYVKQNAAISVGYSLMLGGR